MQLLPPLPRRPSHCNNPIPNEVPVALRHKKAISALREVYLDQRPRYPSIDSAKQPSYQQNPSRELLRNPSEQVYARGYVKGECYEIMQRPALAPQNYALPHEKISRYGSNPRE